MLVLVLLSSSSIAFGNFHESFEENRYYTYFDKLEEPDRIKPIWSTEEDEYAEGVSLTQKAIGSYEFISERSKYLTYRLKNATLGDYTDTLLTLTPLIDGRYNFRIGNFRFKLKPRKDKGTIQYVFKF